MRNFIVTQALKVSSKKFMTAAINLTFVSSFGTCSTRYLQICNSFLKEKKGIRCQGTSPVNRISLRVECRSNKHYGHKLVIRNNNLRATPQFLYFFLYIKMKLWKRLASSKYNFFFNKKIRILFFLVENNLVKTRIENYKMSIFGPPYYTHVWYFCLVDNCAFCVADQGEEFK